MTLLFENAHSAAPHASKPSVNLQPRPLAAMHTPVHNHHLHNNWASTGHTHKLSRPWPCCRSSASSSSSSSSDGQRSPVLILPGFLANATLAPGSQYSEMKRNLEALGHPAADILETNSWDWVPTLSGGSFKWYLQRMADATRRLADKTGSQVSLVGVSAGGWLARLTIARDKVVYDGETFSLADCVHTLVTCGTPHLSLEAYPFGRAEEAWLMELHGLPASVSTSLRYVNLIVPDADSLKPVRVVCLAGNAVRGEQLTVGELVQRVWSGKLQLREANTWAFIQSAYKANCGRVEVDGDAVTPVETAALPGAELLVLPDVWHNAAPSKLWYGSKEVVEVWDKFLP